MDRSTFSRLLVILGMSLLFLESCLTSPITSTITILPLSTPQNLTRTDISNNKSTATPTYKPVTPEPTITPLFRATEITVDDYGQRLSLFVGDVFELQRYDYDHSPLIIDNPQVLQIINDPTAETVVMKAIGIGVARVSSILLFPCPNTGKCQPPWDYTYVNILVTLSTTTSLPSSENKQFLPYISQIDIVQVVLKFPNSHQEVTRLCTQNFKAGLPVFVQMLDNDSYYYVVPFFENGLQCAEASVSFWNGKWQVGWYGSSGHGNKYPPINADEAKAYIEKMTCTKVIDTPIYADRSVYPGPFWAVSTSDGQAYYVMSVVAKLEDYTPYELHIWAWNSKDDYRMWLKPKDCSSNK